MPTPRFAVGLSLATLALLAMGGCAEPTQSEDSGSASSNIEGAVGSLFDNGFSVVTSTTCSADPTAEGCDLAVLDSRGREVSEDSALLASGATLRDRASVGSYTVFRWPRTIPTRSHDAVAKQMREYSTLVGTLLSRDAKGPGEERWVDYQRSEQYSAVRSAMSGGPRAMCDQVVKSFVDDLVPEGSKHLQYGNCGEGGHVGACLALKAGFAAGDIRVCASRNDHFFAMVKHPTKAWCILDRWPLIADDNFACDVDIDAADRVITHEGQPQSSNKWFTDVSCVTLAEYVADPDALR